MNRLIPLSLLALFLSGCVTRPMSYTEWRDKIALEAAARKKGVDFKYKTHEELRKEAAEMRVLADEFVNSFRK